MSNFKKFVDFDKELDIPEATGDKAHPDWFKNKELVPDEKTRIEVETLLKRKGTTFLFQLLSYWIQGRFRSVSNVEFDFNRNNATEAMFYYEGYKQALRDVHKLIPRQ